jgi:hypothetical protein
MMIGSSVDPDSRRTDCQGMKLTRQRTKQHEPNKKYLLATRAASARKAAHTWQCRDAHPTVYFEIDPTILGKSWAQNMHDKSDRVFFFNFVGRRVRDIRRCLNLGLELGTVTLAKQIESRTKRDVVVGRTNGV